MYCSCAVEQNNETKHFVGFPFVFQWGKRVWYGFLPCNILVEDTVTLLRQIIQHMVRSSLTTNIL